MESLEEFTGSNDHSPIMKGKRTKRQRPSSPHGAAATSTSSTGGGDGSSGGGSGASGVGGVGGGGGGDVCSSIPSPTTSSDILSTSTEEDEDMANCLILLAQGLVRPTQLVLENEENKNGKFTTTIGKSEFYVYECKTCNRTFPSFQALGGHRASHKKPKTTIHGEEKRVLPVTPAWVVEEEEEEEVAKINEISSILPPLLTGSANTKSPHLNNKSKVHECSICGSEFSSGQALGGHMRRHRAPPNTRIPMTTVDSTAIVESEEELIGSNKGRNILSLDLNLPAPPEDDHHHHHHHRDSKFEFTPNKKHLVFSAPALVDCHY